jgi:hypothetical protein
VEFETISNADFLLRVNLLTKTRENTREWYRSLIKQIIDLHIDIGKTIIQKPQLIDEKIIKGWTQYSAKKEPPSMDKRIKLLTALLTVGFIERITRAVYEKPYDNLREYTAKLKGAYTITLRDKAANTDLGFTVAQIAKAVMDADPELHLERMIVGLYSLMPPARLDYDDALVHLKEPHSSVLTKGNHVVVTRNARVVLNEYKTDAKYGQLVNIIPPKLKAIILKSLKILPRSYVFGEKPLKPNGGKVHIERASVKILGKKLNATDYRHIYASSADITNMTTEQYSLFALSMGHGPMTSLTKYRTQPINGNEAGPSSSA